ncbi:DUF4349 domain-containing protein [Candidatus Woesearchaeota archaeon]|nr:DUF4349 domain-containing protein [Candidatus Woesearchaeota archaeon]
MTLKTQFQKLKENWLLILLVLLVVFFIPILSGSQQLLPSFSTFERALGESQIAGTKMGSPIYDGGGFAPEATDRKITKTASLSTEVEQGTFKEAESQLKSVVTAAEAFLLNENVQKYDSGRKAYYSGNYYIKVEASKYAAVTAQLRQIGDVQFFQESAEDITEQFTDVQIELDTERERLRRYEQMFAEATTVSEKIELNDRIFDQERRIKYLEEQLENVGTRVDYSTLSVTITEKRSAYADVVFVKFSELVATLVESVSDLLQLLVAVLPYAVLVAVGWLVIKKVRKRR